MLLVLWLFFIIAWFADRAGSHQFDVPQEVSDAIYDMVKAAPERKITRNIEYRYGWGWDIVKASSKHYVPEMLLAVKVKNESSFKTDVWDKTGTTYGAGQMHGAAVRGCDQSTRIGQLECSAKWLRVCFDKCQGGNFNDDSKGWFRALSCYGTSGYCDWRKAKYPKKYRNSLRRQIKQWQDLERMRDSVRNEIMSDTEYYAEMNGE